MIPQPGRPLSGKRNASREASGGVCGRHHRKLDDGTLVEGMLCRGSAGRIGCIVAELNGERLSNRERSWTELNGRE